MPADRTTSYAAHEQERRDDIRTIVATIDAQRDKYAGILPSNIKFDDFRNAFLIAVQINPRLLEADRQSLWLALQKAASAGLKPDNHEGALVIFGDDSEDDDGNPVPSQAKGKKKVQWLPMVWGITKQMRNTGNVASVRCKVIYRGERVIVTDEDGRETYKHTRVIEAGSDVDETDENVVGAYAVVTYKDGFWDAEFMSRRQIGRIQARAKSKRGPWATHFAQMAMKTPLRRLSLRVEKSAENARYFQAIQDDETLTTIDGDTVTETPPPAIEADNSIRQEFTKPADKQTVRNTAKQQQAADNAKTASQPTNGVSDPKSGPDNSKSSPTGKPAPDPDAERRAMEEEIAASAGQTASIEIWAFDDNGEPAEQMEPFGTTEFASWFCATLFKSGNPEGLREHNADNIAECRGTPGFQEISDAIARDQKRREDDAKPKGPAPKKQRVAIEVPKTPKGALHWGNYTPMAVAEIAEVTDESDLADWIAVNQPTYKSRLPEIAIENRIRQRREVLRGTVNPPTGGVPASEETEKRPVEVETPMTDAEFVTAAKAQIETLLTDDDVLKWCAVASVVAAMDGMRKRDKPLWQTICDAIDARRVVIAGMAEEPPA